ncbi:MAG TPA: prepilin peptidase [Fibrobacteraceae bacterium]|jgi:leader peptidase (prepilin peptidase)/N-methyltransferase|nr:prepilin peptidase [Fibrobacteraceae bacterium]HQB64804.1 prepilin peptidase [Fibrobacteraceae bacterium]
MAVNLSLRLILFVSLLIFASYEDLKKREIPGAICMALVMISLLDFNLSNLLGILAAMPFFIAAMIWTGSIGGGDIKLTAATGLILGLNRTLVGLMMGLTVMCLFHLIIMMIEFAKQEKNKTTSYPMAPFLAIGFLTAYFL